MAKTLSQKITTDINGRIALDLDSYLKIARRFLKSSQWEENVIGIAMVIPRRAVEIIDQMQFYPDTKYSVTTSQPVKKKFANDYYVCPTLVESSLVLKAIENVRTNKPDNLASQDQRKLGNHIEANEQVNNTEEKYVLKIYNEKLKPYLPSGASLKNKDNFHQLRHVVTTVLYDLKNKEVGGNKGLEKEIVKPWVRDSLGHATENLSDLTYADWIINGIPKYSSEIAKVNSRIVTPEYLGIEIEDTSMAIEIFNYFQELCTEEIEKIESNHLSNTDRIENVKDQIDLAKQLLINSQGNGKSSKEIAFGLKRLLALQTTADRKTDSAKKALGLKANLTTAEMKLTWLFETIAEWNKKVDDVQKVYVNPSSLRGYYSVYYEILENGDLKELSVNIKICERLLEEQSLDLEVTNNGLEPRQNLLNRKYKKDIKVGLRSMLQELHPNAFPEQTKAA